MGWLDVEVLAGEQYGLITSAQVDVRGVSRATLHRKVRQGYVQQVRRGVYVLSSARWDIHRDLRAAWLSSAMIADLRARVDAACVRNGVAI